MAVMGSKRKKEVWVNSLTGEDICEKLLHIRIESDSHQFRIGNDVYGGAVEAVLTSVKEIEDWLDHVVVEVKLPRPEDRSVL